MVSAKQQECQPAEEADLGVEHWQSEWHTNGKPVAKIGQANGPK